MLGSRFERRPGDRYWTEPWVTRTLVDAFPPQTDVVVWEPACGRGDMARVLLEHDKVSVLASDVDLSDWPADLPEAVQHDFLESDDANLFVARDAGVMAVVTNPPYGARATMFARACHRLLAAEDCPVLTVSLLLRADFDCAKTRTDLFRDSPYFAAAIRVLGRPRWDDWDSGEPPRAAPRHNYTWYHWMRGRPDNHPPAVLWGGAQKRRSNSG